MTRLLLQITLETWESLEPTLFKRFQNQKSKAKTWESGVLLDKNLTKYVYKYNQSKTILRLFYLLAWFPFTTSEKEPDYCHQKLNAPNTYGVGKWH